MGWLAPLLLLRLAGAAAAPPVYVYHDDRYANFGYLDPPKAVTLQAGEFWPVAVGDVNQATPFHRALSEALVRALGDSGYAARLLDAAGWLRVCEAREQAVVIDICQTVPDLVFRGQADGSPLEDWLDAGGALIYSGDWPFYWYCDADGKVANEGAGPVGDDAIFDVDLVKDGFDGIATNPTDIAKQRMPSLRGSWALRPFDLKAVEATGTPHVTFLRGERGTQVAADGIALRMPKGKGWFMGLQMTRGQHTDTAQAILELLKGLPADAALWAGDAR